jgi:urease accessory protein
MSVQHGYLNLVFGQHNGKTVIKKSSYKAPLQIVRPFELECGTLSLTLLNMTAGIMEGDTLELNIVLEEGAKVVLLTQTANKIHSMQGGFATQHMTITQAANSRLEYYPERNIPFVNADYRQKLRVNLASSAQFTYMEGLSAGRVLHGESWKFKRYSSQVDLFVDQELVYLERQDIMPQVYPVAALGIMEDAQYLLSGCVIGALELEHTPHIHVGKTQHQHIWIRGMSQRNLELDVEARGLQNKIRKMLWGCGELRVRR